MKHNHTLQLWLAAVSVCFGIGLIIAAIAIPPPGVIDPTVLTAYGETLTFAGALVGIDYHYRDKNSPPQPPKEDV